jgi:translation initiation factor 6 (eIF-6)
LQKKHIRAPQNSKCATLEPTLPRDAKDEINRALDVAAAKELTPGMSIQGVLPALQSTGVEAVVCAGG